MLQTQSDSNIIQVFPIGIDTQVLNAGDSMTTYGYDVIHFTSDTSIKFTFTDDTELTLDGTAAVSGTDFGIGDRVKSITINSGSALVS